MVPPAVAALGLVTLLALVAASAFFSSSETAIFTLSEEWLAAHEPSGDGRLDALRDPRSDPHGLLVTILVGNNVVNVAIASVATALLVESLPTGAAITVATVIASVVVLVFGEIVPKSYGLGRAEQRAVAAPLTFVERAFSPVVTVFDIVTRGLTARSGGETGIGRPNLEE